jgi:hypothetical protein
MAFYTGSKVTFLTTHVHTASPKILSVKVIHTGTSIDTLLSEFLELTRPSGVQREVRHNTVHHIRNTPGPPVNY